MEKAQEAQSITKKKITEQDNKLFNEQFASVTTVPPSDKKEKPKVEEISSCENGTSLESELKLNLEPSESSSSKADSGTSSIKKVSPRQPSSISSSPSTSPRLPPVPKTSYQFQTDWKVLRKHPQQFYQYLKVSHIQYLKGQFY